MIYSDGLLAYMHLRDIKQSVHVYFLYSRCLLYQRVFVYTIIIILHLVYSYCASKHYTMIISILMCQRFLFTTKCKTENKQQNCLI